MARVKSPLLSASATGTIGNTLTFQRTPRGVKVFKYNLHGDAHTSSQLSQRSKYLSAVASWNALTPSEKNYWTSRAGTKFVSGYHAYLSYTLTTIIIPPYGGIDQYTKLMLHCNGTDASNLFLDSELTPKDITPHGDAQLDTAQKKFGNASALFDGTGDYLTVLDFSDWNFSNANFTIDTWAYLNEAMGATQRTFAGLGGGTGDWGPSGHEWLLFLYTNQYLYFQYKTTIEKSLQSTNVVDVDNGWHHFAVVRYGNTMTIYLDGISVISATETASIAHIVGGSPRLAIANDASLVSPWKGWLDEFRISNGIARWTTNFTPPTHEYTTL